MIPSRETSSVARARRSGGQSRPNPVNDRVFEETAWARGDRHDQHGPYRSARAGRQCGHGVGKRHRGRDVASARLRVRRAQSRCQLSRLSRQPGQLSRKPRPAVAVVPARGSRAGNRARLCQGDGSGNGGHAARERRTHAWLAGYLQRLVRSPAGLRHGGERSGRRMQTPPLDRVDPLVEGPGRAAPPQCQVGRRATLAPRAGGEHAAGGCAHEDTTQGSGVCLPRRRAAGARARSRSRNSAGRAIHGARSAARIGAGNRTCRRSSRRRRAAGDPDGPVQPLPAKLEPAGAAGGAAWRAGRNRPQVRGGVPHRARPARRGTDVANQSGCDRRGEAFGRDPPAGLDRSCRSSRRGRRMAYRPG